MNKKKSLLWAILFLVALHSFAQVGMGIEKPNAAAMLDINSSNKGILVPRVALNSTTFDLDGLPTQPNGLLIYNTGGALAEGFYFWNGTEWENLLSSAIIAPQIEDLDCNNAILEPLTFMAGVPYVGILKVPYTGGNGGKYPAQKCVSALSGNTSLTACLKAGILEHGRGYLLYDVTGTPTSSSPVGATFPVSFGNKTCEVKVGYTENATMMSTFSVGPLVPVSNNGGSQRVVTSFDGKFSVRIFVAPGNTLNNGNFQIRHNLSPLVTIMWNGLTGNSSINAMANNSFLLENRQTWYSIGPQNVTTPEQRNYIWTTTDVKDKTVYHLTAMIGNASPSNFQSDKTIIFLKIEQIQAN
ncbi:MAG: hypothetical protein LBB84_04225 [Tannerellaceae bacterium]|nr:hypothetical protein [Tannerellaceae bacterium]